MGKMVQIIPADNWRVVFAERGEDGAMELHAEQLAYWGLLEDEEGFRWTAGFGASDLAYPCESAGNFVGYVHLDDLLEDLHSRSLTRVRVERYTPVLPRNEPPSVPSTLTLFSESG